MENPEFFGVLVKRLYEKKIILKRELISLQEEQSELTTEQQEITDYICETERQIVLITEDKIREYQIFWNHTPYVCPFCYVFYNKPSLFNSDKITWNIVSFQCNTCGEWFDHEILL